MKTIKTAISIDGDVFRRVRKLTKKLHISRSRFFSQAARYMIDRDENCELLRKIDAACADDDTPEERDFRDRVRKYSRRNVRNTW